MIAAAVPAPDPVPPRSLVLDGVAKRFGGIEAIRSVTMSIPPACVTGLIGPNGAGKTTVVNLITGIYKLTAGRIRFGDEDITEAEPHHIARAGIARTFQTIRLLKEASVLDNVVVGFHRRERTSLGVNLLGLPGARRERAEFRAQARALLSRFGLMQYADLPAGALSYGHQRRVEMMRALAAHPVLVLLDEPVAGMNDAEAAELAVVLREFTAEGLGILLIEHNMRFVMSLCTEIHVLANGTLIASGAPETIAHHPAVIQAYLGA
jgi:branched-chain amino acid transport system ATP-binding protein